jgi:hypothetical protein
MDSMGPSVAIVNTSVTKVPSYFSTREADVISRGEHEADALSARAVTGRAFATLAEAGIVRLDIVARDLVQILHLDQAVHNFLRGLVNVEH